MASIAKFFTSRRVAAPTPLVQPVKITLPRERSAASKSLFRGFTASELEANQAPLSGISQELLQQIAQHQIRGFTTNDTVVKKLITAQQEQQAEDLIAYQEARTAYYANGGQFLSAEAIDGDEAPPSATYKVLLNKAQEAKDRGEVQLKRELKAAAQEVQLIDYYQFLVAKADTILASPVYPAAQQFTAKDLARTVLPESERVIQLREIVKAAQYLAQYALVDKLNSRIDEQLVADVGAWEQVKEVHARKQAQAVANTQSYVPAHGYTIEQLQARFAPTTQTTLDLNAKRLKALNEGDHETAALLFAAVLKSKQQDVDLWEEARGGYFVHLSKQNGTYDAAVSRAKEAEERRLNHGAFEELGKQLRAAQQNAPSKT